MRSLETAALRSFPEAPSVIPRLCLIAPEGRLVTIRLAVDSGLRAAGRFWLLDPIYRPGRFPLLKWEMDTGEKGEVQHGPGVPSEALDLHSLSFTIHACAPVADVDEGTIQVSVFQGDSECPIMPSAIFHRRVVPRCDGRVEPDRLDNGFVFHHRS